MKKKTKEELEELIEGYFDDRLSEEEEKLYEELHVIDTGFAEQADLYREVHLAIEYMRNEAILKQNGFYDEVTTPKVIPLKRGMQTWKVISIAASILLAISAISIWQFQPKKGNLITTNEQTEQQEEELIHTEDNKPKPDATQKVTTHEEKEKSINTTSKETTPQEYLAEAIEPQYPSNLILDEQVMRYESNVSTVRGKEDSETTAFTVIHPANDSQHTRKVRFEWKFKDSNDKALILRILNHQQYVVHEVILRPQTNTYEWNEDKPDGVYYWRISQEENNQDIFWGKFIRLNK